LEGAQTVLSFSSPLKNIIRPGRILVKAQMFFRRSARENRLGRGGIKAPFTPKKVKGPPGKAVLSIGEKREYMKNGVVFSILKQHQLPMVLL